MTIKGSRSKKRHGRPGVATATAGPKPSRSRPASGVGEIPDRSAAADTAVKPDRNSSALSWGVPAWLMLGSAMWSATVAWQLIATIDDAPVTPDGGTPYFLITAAIVAALASGIAFVLLRRGSTHRVRPLLILAAASGVFAIFSTIAALVCMWMVRRDRR